VTNNIVKFDTAIKSITTMKCFSLLILPLVFLSSCSKKAAVNEDDYKMDLRYSPSRGQTCICLPDEVQKTIVDDRGTFLFDYVSNGPLDGFNVSLSAGIDSTIPERSEQRLYTAKIPILITSYSDKGLIFTSEIFAVAPSLKNAPIDSCELSLGFRGYPHNDIMLITLRNSSDKDTTVTPRIQIISVYPVKQGRDKKSLTIDNRISVTLPSETISSSKSPVYKGHSYSYKLSPLTVKAGAVGKIAIAVNIGSKAVQLYPSVDEAEDLRTKAISYWKSYPFPYDHISVPDSNVQNLIYSCIRNIYQAREIKKGLPAFQVGPTCYRGLWIIDGSFLLESMTFLGQLKDVRNGIEYMLGFQNKDGSFLLMDSHWKETGIVLWVIDRHGRLTGDKAWLESKWENVVRAVNFIDTLRARTMKNADAPNRGLVPAGFSDGGLARKTYEFTNVYWTLNGLKSAVDIAVVLNKEAEAALWKARFDTMFTAYRRAAVRSLRTDSCGNRAVPIYMTDECQLQRGQWAFCHAVFPGKLFADNDSLMTGTMNMLRCNEREGLVYETGWQDKGVWNYFGSFYAHAWLWLGDGQKAARTMYAMANHASSTLVWREEQPVRTVKTRQMTGDMPHNWASAEFIRMARNFIALERGGDLHLFEGLPPTWTKPGMQTSLQKVCTDFGILDVLLKISDDGKKAYITVDLDSSGYQKPSAVVIHLDVLKGAGKIIKLKPVFPMTETIKL
jgi:hypothetical protein